MRAVGRGKAGHPSATDERPVSDRVSKLTQPVADGVSVCGCCG